MGWGSETSSLRWLWMAFKFWDALPPVRRAAGGTQVPAIAHTVPVLPQGTAAETQGQPQMLLWQQWLWVSGQEAFADVSVGLTGYSH